MKILLIHPPWSDIYGKYKSAARVGVLYPPLGLCYLASSLQRDGHKVKILDVEAEGLGIERLVEIVKESSPDIVGITSTTPIFNQAKILAERLKEETDVITILGGPHMTVLPERSMEDCKAFDYGIYGEGESTFCELVQILEGKDDIKSISGIVYRDKNEIVKTKPRELEQDMDLIPFPDRRLLDIDKYLWSVPQKGIVRFATIMTSRGCPFQCIFCSQRTVFGTKVRYRSPENVINEIEDIIELGIKHLIFIDDTLTLKRERVVEICNIIIERRLDITWEGWTQASTVDENLLRLMKEAGFVRVSFGIESGNPEILKIIKKGITLQQIKNAYILAKKVGLETRGSVMLGHPFETKKTAMDTLNFINNLKECDQVFINITTPYPGTELYETALNGGGGMRLLTSDFSKYKRYGDAVIEVNNLSRRELVNLQRKGFLMFYLTPRRLAYNLRRAGLGAGIKNAMAFIRSII